VRQRAQPRVNGAPHRAAMTLTTELDEPHTDPAVCNHPAHGRLMPRRPGVYPLVRTNSPDGPGRQLINEWDVLSRKRTTITTINSWGLFGHPIDELDDVLVALGFGGAVDDSDSDHLLWHMVVLAEHDLLAARIVLHRVMPALLAVAKRRGAIITGGIDAALGDIIPAAWVVIRTFPHRRRLVKIAANIALDSEYHAFVREARLRRVTEVAVTPEIFGATRQVSQRMVTDAELHAVLAEAESRGVPAEMIDLLRRFGLGNNSDAIAAETGWSPRTIRNHRRAALDAVREALRDRD